MDNEYDSERYNGSSYALYYYDWNDTSFGDFVTPFSKTSTRIAFIVSYVLVFATCLIGNTMVLFAIARSPRLRSKTNLFLANLAVADLCVGVFCILPNLSTFLSQNWILGRVMCKIYYYVWNFSYTASIVILMVIAGERYLAIISPLKARLLITLRKLIIIQVMVWVIACVYNIPYLIFYDTVELPILNEVFCYFDEDHETALKNLSIANLIAWYILPLGIMGLLYFKIGRTLWKTRVVSALRLRSQEDSLSSSIRSYLTKSDSPPLSHPESHDRHNDSQEKPERRGDEPQGDIAYVRSGDDCKQNCLIVQFNGNGTLIISNNLHPGPNSPHDLKRFGRNVPEMQTIDKDIINRFEKQYECTDQNSELSRNRPSIRYRLTNLKKSKKVVQRRKEVIRLLATIVILFAICVLPHHIKVVNHYWNFYYLPHSVDVYISPCSFILLYLNSALNPIVYALFSKNFRTSFKDSLRCFRKRQIKVGSNRINKNVKRGGQ